nr:TerD family protein [Paenibacillus oenotherae]
MIKGQKADITKNNASLTSLVIGMGWRNTGQIELDFSAFIIGGNGKVTRDEDLIFYGNPSGASGAVSINANKQAYAGVTDNEQLAVQLRNIPPQYERVALTLTVYEGEQRKQSFSSVQDCYLRIMDGSTGSEVIRFNLESSFSVETAIVVGELYRHNGEWKFSAIASGFSGGLADLCRNYGIEVKADAPSPPSSNPAPPPAPVVQPPKVQNSPPPAPPAPPVSTPPAGNPVNLNKIELKKRGDSINLQKNGPLGEILINLNWNQTTQKKGWFGGSSGVDLDLACLYELKNGDKGVVQALGEAFGNFQRAPYVELDGDDRTGSVKSGENIRINGNKLSEIKRLLVFTFIYQGATNWSEADGVVTLKQSGGPDIIVRMDEHNNRKGMCAIALIKNVNDQTFSIERLVQFYSGHRELDEAYNWGLRWKAGSK